MAWSILPQEQGDEEVLVKFGHHIPEEKNGSVQFIRLHESRGWIAVHLQHQTRTGPKKYKLHFSPAHGTYIFHHPDRQVPVLVQGRVTNPLNPEMKKEPNKKSLGRCVDKAKRYVARITKNPELTEQCFELLAECYEAKQKEWEEAAAKKKAA